MNRATLTPGLISAAGMDAGNRSARKAGRKAWNAEDLEAATQTASPLWDIWEAAERKRCEGSSP